MNRKVNVKTRSSTLDEGFSDSNDYLSYMKNNVKKCMYMSPTSASELEDIVNSLESDKASDISVIILKKCFHYISEHLAGFFNQFILSGTFPDILKVSKITPIF